MKSNPPTNRASREYEVLLRRIQARLLSARNTLAAGSEPRSLESAALDLRVALEELLLSSLVTHQHHLGEVTKALSRSDWSDARKRVEKINPYWWPIPQDITAGGPDGVKATVTGHHDDDFMTADEWGRAYGAVSDLLHARNPFRAPQEKWVSKQQELQSIYDRLWRLLMAHTLDVGSPGYLLVGRFDDHAVQVGILQKMAYDQEGSVHPE